MNSTNAYTHRGGRAVVFVYAGGYTLVCVSVSMCVCVCVCVTSVGACGIVFRFDLWNCAHP